MTDPVRAEVARAELDRLGLKFHFDVRTTLRRILLELGPAPRAAFAAATAERVLRSDETRSDGGGGHAQDWRPVLDEVWRGLAGDAAALAEVAAAVGAFYLSPAYRRRHDDPSDRTDHTMMAAFYAAECYLHGCMEFAAWTGWRGFDVACLCAAADLDWPHRRPVGMTAYAWELAHPSVQAELDQQLVDLELLAEPGDAGPGGLRASGDDPSAGGAGHVPEDLLHRLRVGR